MEDIKSNATAELLKIPKEAFHRCFQQWQDRCSKCVCVQGSCFEGDKVSVAVCPTIRVIYYHSGNFLTTPRIVHHTYQFKEERAYRVVIKYLHYSVNTKEIDTQLTKMGHKVRNVINDRHRVTKQPLNIFFVDLEPASNNKDIYNIVTSTCHNIYMIQNKTVVIGPSRRNKGLTQCFKCQLYGHTKTYCNRPFVCVKYGGPNCTANCKNPNTTPAKCALCDGSHPANYKGCEFYHSLIKTNNADNRQNVQRNPTVNMHNSISLARPEIPKPTTNNAYRNATLCNTNGLIKHKDEIETFLDHNAIDILLVSETHFTDRTLFRIPHYNAYFASHPDSTAHAGTGILIKNNISHYELPKFEKTNRTTSVIATISTEVVNRKTSPRLHNRRTNWTDYRIETEEAINLHISPKSPEELDISLTNTLTFLKKQVTFTMRKEQCPAVHINNTLILQSSTVKYLGLHLDSRLTWKQHIAQKKKTAIMQGRQSKILQMIKNAPWYVTNQTLHDDLNVSFIKKVIQERSMKHHDKLGHHSNTLLQPLLEQQQRRRLKKLWPADPLDG
ncbi:hypothetical protein B7P43_G08372 [Cryptotermes secundus]|uniref:Pre-C2HC domain-containing protein n=1 Tax=Cryptotermes secundus TaxID=105785 RepID=A0A2J7RAI6_9NEOP|nr:hypothetical protein B7P43_G08372 [Cryptotermes secundus]